MMNNVSKVKDGSYEVLVNASGVGFEYHMIDESNGERVNIEDKDGCIYKPFGYGLTVRTVSPNVVSSWLDTARAKKEYQIELDKRKNERDAKLELNQRVLAVHERILNLSTEVGFINNRRPGENDLFCYDEPTYTVAHIEDKVVRDEVNDLLLDDIKKSLTVVMTILAKDYPNYCSSMLRALSMHKDAEFRAYIKMLKAMIAFCG